MVAASLRAQAPSAPDAEDAADFARRAALGALHGPSKTLLDALDADGILRRAVGSEVWGALAPRQRDGLREFLRGRFLDALAGAPGAPADVSWISVGAPGTDGTFPVTLGLSYGGSSLKTRWLTRRAPRGWLIEDVVLVDPGISVADEVRSALGPHPLVPRDTSREARARAARCGALARAREGGAGRRGRGPTRRGAGRVAPRNRAGRARRLDPLSPRRGRARPGRARFRRAGLPRRARRVAAGARRRPRARADRARPRALGRGAGAPRAIRRADRPRPRRPRRAGGRTDQPR